MGMTLAETFLFLAGGLLLSFFLVRTIAPFFRSRLEETADRRARDLREEFLRLSPRRILLILLAAAGLFGSVAAAFVRDFTWVATAAAVPVFFSGLAVRHYRVRRRKQVIRQLPGFLDLLAGHVKAGHSLQEAIPNTVPLLSGNIRNEVAWLAQFSRLGMPLPQALLLWEQRMPCEEISLVVRPLRVALPAGGNVVDLLARSRDILRARIRMEDRMKALTAQARLQALVLTLLPPAFVAALSKIDPEFLPRCLETAPGKAILALATLLMSLGWLTIRKILSVKA
jgi:tight adherence protein B